MNDNTDIIEAGGRSPGDKPFVAARRSRALAASALALLVSACGAHSTSLMTKPGHYEDKTQHVTLDIQGVDAKHISIRAERSLQRKDGSIAYDASGRTMISIHGPQWGLALSGREILWLYDGAGKFSAYTLSSEGISPVDNSAIRRFQAEGEDVPAALRQWASAHGEKGSSR